MFLDLYRFFRFHTKLLQGFVSKKRIWIIEDDGNHCGEVSGIVTMLGNKCRGSGTCTAQTGTGTPKLEFNSGQAVPVPL